MAHFRTLRNVNETGFDESRNLLVVPLGKTASLYLVDTSILGTDVKTDHEDVAKVAEQDLTAREVRQRRFAAADRKNPLSLVTVKGLRVGTTVLRSQRTVGSEDVEPVEVRVVDNADSRQSGDRGAISSEFRKELLGMSVRQAVIRVAEDQMYSKIGRSTRGHGRYAADGYEWCGAFAWYCWNVACTVHGVPNPFGDKYGSLLSCQKAISWALQTDTCTILRYKGHDPYGNSFTTGKSLGKATERQEYIEIDPENPVLPADICVIRLGSPADWKHVCLAAEEPAGDNLMTLNGNMGAKGGRCISKQPWSMTAKVNNGKDYAMIYLHVLGFDE